MKILALDSSTAAASAALFIDGHVVGEQISHRQKSHSEVLNGFVNSLLEKEKLTLSEIDFFAVCQGPGSFTGLRIAGNIAKTFAYSFNKPLVTVDSLSLLAMPCPRHKPVLAMINAYKNMVYYGLFKAQEGIPQFDQGPGVQAVKDLEKIIKSDCTVIGDGFIAYQEFFPNSIQKLFERNSNLSDEPRAAQLAVMAEQKIQSGQTLDWKSFIPLYIRASEAEENKRGIFLPKLD